MGICCSSCIFWHRKDHRTYCKHAGCVLCEGYECKCLDTGIEFEYVRQIATKLGTKVLFNDKLIGGRKFKFRAVSSYKEAEELAAKIVNFLVVNNPWWVYSTSVSVDRWSNSVIRPVVHVRAKGY